MVLKSYNRISCKFICVGIVALISFFLGTSIYAAGEQEEEKEGAASVAVIPQAPSTTQAQAAVEEKRAAERQMRSAAQKADRERREKEEGEVKEGAVQEIDTNVRTLLMFLDNSEINTGHLTAPATTFAAIDAMNQEAGPILISGSLLAHIFNSKGNHIQRTRMILEAFYEKFDATRWAVYGSKKKEGDVLSHDFLLIPLEVQDRLIKTMVEDFNVEGLEKIETVEKKALETYFNFDTPKDVAGRARTLYEHALRLASDSQFLEEYPKECLSFLKYVLLPINHKSDIDYTGRLTDEAARWIFFLEGHGEYKKSIAGLSIESIDKKDSEFQQLLDFFDKKIKVKLFAYKSCYAAGYNAKEVYGELTGAAGTRVYPFGIVTGAITDAQARTFYKVVESGIISEVSYAEFFENVIKEPVNYSLALGFLFPFIKKASSDPTFNPSLIVSLPQIRPPYAPAWFPVVDVDKAVVRIGKITAENRKKDLIIKQYIDGFGKAQDPKAILLATNEVPFPVIIDAGIIIKPPFVSISPGEQEHTLQSITYEGMEFDTFGIDAVIGKLRYGAMKTFFVRKLKIVNKKGESKIFNNVDIKVQKSIKSAVGYDENGAEYDFAIEVTGKDLLEAVARGDLIAAVELLIDNAPVNYRDKDGDTALIKLIQISSFADERFVKGIAQLLIADGADINAVSTIQEQGGGSRQLTVLQFACLYNSPMLVKLLLESNRVTDINAQDQDKYGDTALHIAMLYAKSKDLVKLLLQYNANPDLKNKAGISPRNIDAQFMKEVERELAPEKHKQLESWKKWREKSEKHKGRKKKGKQQLFPHKIRSK